MEGLCALLAQERSCDRAEGDTPPLDDGGRRHEVAGGAGADPR